MEGEIFGGGKICMCVSVCITFAKILIMYNVSLYYCVICAFFGFHRNINAVIAILSFEICKKKNLTFVSSLIFLLVIKALTIQSLWRGWAARNYARRLRAVNIYIYIYIPYIYIVMTILL